MNYEQRQNLLAQIQQMLSSSKNEIVKGFDSSADSIYQEASEDTLKRFTRSGLTQSTFSIVDKQAISQLYQNLNEIKSEFNIAIDQIMQNSALNARSIINTIINQEKLAVSEQIAKEAADYIASGKILGESRQKISAKLIQHFQGVGIKSVQVPSMNTRSGVRNYTLRSSVNYLVQSSLIRSSTAGVLERSMNLGHDLVRVSSHGDPSPMCQPYQGKIYSTSGTSTEYDALSSIMFGGNYKKGGGIHHPYCRHSLTIAIPSRVKLDVLNE
jgi:hypothetical protein